MRREIEETNYLTEIWEKILFRHRDSNPQPSEYVRKKYLFNFYFRNLISAARATCITATNRILKYMNASADPCEDFYQVGPGTTMW